MTGALLSAAEAALALNDAVNEGTGELSEAAVKFGKGNLLFNEKVGRLDRAVKELGDDDLESDD